VPTSIADDEHSGQPDPRAIVRVTVPEVFVGITIKRLQRHQAVLHSIEKIDNAAVSITAEIAESKLKRASWAIVNSSGGRAKVVRLE
jgi:translation elongation factor EF-G